MKFRIFGTLFVLTILAGVYALTQDGGNKAPVPQSPPVSDPGFKPLNIN